MKFKFILLIVLFAQNLNLWANPIQIEIQPPKPVVGENFQILFRVSTDSEFEPEVNFAPNNLEVLNRQSQGISTKTIYSQGRLKISREYLISFEAVAKKAGIGTLRDIEVLIDSKKVTHPSVNITVLKEPQTPQEVFLRADVDKTQAYIGEGLVVRYYIYSKGPLNNIEVKKYPQLNRFLKRFLQESDQAERVSVDNEIYFRRQIYAAKIYPEKAGSLKIDPLILSVSYVSMSSSDQFGFGFGMRNIKTKTISSQKQSIEVIDLPKENRPANFSGLVGEHKINLKNNRSKILVNEPLIFNLTIEGEGALEKFEATDIISDSNFEDFESKSDLKLIDANLGIKTFDFTYLPKKPGNYSFPDYVISYFDPIGRKYIVQKIPINEIIIGGNAVKENLSQSPMPGDNSIKPIPANEHNQPKVLELQNLSSVNLNGLLIIFNLLILLIYLIYPLRTQFTQFKTYVSHLSRTPRFFKPKNTSDLIGLLKPLIARTGKNPIQIIQESPLSDLSKTNLVKYVVDLNKNDFSGDSKGAIKVDERSLKELKKYIEKINDEKISIIS